MNAVAAETVAPVGEFDGLTRELLDPALRAQLDRIDPNHRIELRTLREGGLVDCYVPFDLLDNEEVPVKEAWADSLANMFGKEAQEVGGTGQHTAVMLGLIETEPLLKLADGYHRSAALRLRGEPRVYATLKLTDWETLFDDRIFAAKDHTQVRFSRVVLWMRESWQLSGLAERMSIESAVLLYRHKTDGSKLKLSPEDVAAAKAWVERKEEQWDIAAMTIHSHLKVAEHVDPKLVLAAREKVNPHELTAPTQTILEVFANELKDKFVLQNVVMEAAMKQNLTAPLVNAVCDLVKDCKTAKAARAKIAAIDWKTLEPKYGRTVKSSLRRAYDPRHNGADVLSKSATEIGKVIARVDQSLERDEEVNDEMLPNVEAAQQRVVELIEALGELTIKLRLLAGEDEPEKPDKSTAADTSRGRSPVVPASRSRKPTTPPAAPEAPPPNGDSPHAVEFIDGLRAFLSGKSQDIPEMKTRVDIARAEHMIRFEATSGPTRLLDEVREEIKIARAHIARS